MEPGGQGDFGRFRCGLHVFYFSTNVVSNNVVSTNVVSTNTFFTNVVSTIAVFTSADFILCMPYIVGGIPC